MVATVLDALFFRSFNKKVHSHTVSRNPGKYFFGVIQTRAFGVKSSFAREAFLMAAETTLEKLKHAESMALELFRGIEDSGMIIAGKTEKQLTDDVFELAREMFGIEKYWHKRIVRTGKNTLCPYDENPPTLMIAKDDILFFDLGPIFDEYEADIGRTYVLGDDPAKHKIAADIETAWYEIRDWFHSHTSLTGAECFDFAKQTAEDMGWEYGIEIAGHLVGKFPHERGRPDLYLCLDNPNDVFAKDADGNTRHWILELQFVDRTHGYGSFFEQLLI